jgi:hypothetical protein
MIVPPGDSRRVHITNPRDWGMACGTDYWANFGDLTLVPTGAQDLVNYGWVESGTWATRAGVGGDLLASADKGTIGGANIDTASDGITSPYVFGDYAHAAQAEGILGYLPTTLNFECVASFAANNNEQDSGFGFSAAGAAEPAVKAGHVAFVTSDGTDFSLESSAAAATSDSNDDQGVHLWKVTLTAGGAISWFIDGTEQTNTLALRTDIFPVAWGAAAQTANDPVISWVHIWYS